MLEPVTKEMTDMSTIRGYAFAFYCDICKKVWESDQVYSIITQKDQHNEWQYDHYAAYERANLEAMQHFNRCPVCKRWVCDACFCILEEKDVCKECAENISQIK